VGRWYRKHVGPEFRKKLNYKPLGGKTIPARRNAEIIIDFWLGLLVKGGCNGVLGWLRSITGQARKKILHPYAEEIRVDEFVSERNSIS